MSQVNTIKEVLTAARWMIANVGWCQGAFYTTKDGLRGFNIDNALISIDGVDTLSNDVCCLCASGAVYLVDATEELQNQSLDFLWGTIGVGTEVSIPDWNDQPKRTKKQVLAAFDRAIRMAP